jgi:hypothetical protein
MFYSDNIFKKSVTKYFFIEFVLAQQLQNIIIPLQGYVIDKIGFNRIKDFIPEFSDTTLDLPCKQVDV